MAWRAADRWSPAGPTPRTAAIRTHLSRSSSLAVTAARSRGARLGGEHAETEARIPCNRLSSSSGTSLKCGITPRPCQLRESVQGGISYRREWSAASGASRVAKSSRRLAATPTSSPAMAAARKDHDAESLHVRCPRPTRSEPSSRLIRPLVAHAQLSGAKQDRLSPTRFMQIRLHHFPTCIRIHPRQRPTGEVLLKGQVQESERVAATLTDQPGEVAHVGQEATRLLLRFDAGFFGDAIRIVPS